MRTPGTMRVISRRALTGSSSHRAGPGLPRRPGTGHGRQVTPGARDATPACSLQKSRVHVAGARIVGPEYAGERAGWDDTPGVQREQSEQDPQLAAADVDWAPRPVPHLKGPSSPIPSAFGIALADRRDLALLRRVIQRVESPYAS
jgi:hypothetical protein